LDGGGAESLHVVHAFDRVSGILDGTHQRVVAEVEDPQIHAVRACRYITK
jgi:hypothetical protein